MAISCIILKTKDELKKLSKEECEIYNTRLTTEFYNHLRCVQDNPFQPNELKEVSSKHMSEISKQLEWLSKR